MKILNLYSGIGGNRKLWEGHEITAVEYNEEIAGIYHDLFPDDLVFVTDAHQFLLDHYKEYDFIWSSPPCPSHSRSRFWSSKGGMYPPVYPDPSLWQEITFLQHFAECRFVVENVIPYYKPYIDPTVELERHLFWSNFPIQVVKFKKEERDHNIINVGNALYGFNIEHIKINHRKDQILRNLVNPEIGLHILNQAMGIPQQSTQLALL